MTIATCPRCKAPMEKARLSSTNEGGAFRSAEVETQRCTKCKAQVLESEEARRFLGDPELGKNATERDRKPTRIGCPTPECYGSLDQVTLGWGARWVVMEQCPRCLLLVADPGEIEAATGLRRAET